MPNLWCACEVQMSNNAPEDTADKPREHRPGGGVDCAPPLSECHFGGGGLATAPAPLASDLGTPYLCLSSPFPSSANSVPMIWTAFPNDSTQPWRFPRERAGSPSLGSLLLLLSSLWLCDPMDCTTQAFLPFTISQTSLKLMPIESVMPSNHLILCHALLLPSIFPSIRVFSNELALHIRWPKYWSVSFSISPSINIQSWFPLGLTLWSPCSPRDSQESSPAPQFKGINSLVLSLLHGPTLTSIHDYWKNHSFD